MSSLSEVTRGAIPFRYPDAENTESDDFENIWNSEGDASMLETRLAQARAEGVREGEMRARNIFEQDLRETRAALESAIHDFLEDRTRHFRDLEGEVVRLALSISRRILRRESQVDPSLLLSLVRAALSELDQTSPVRLFVHPASVDEWKRFFAESGPRQYAPEVFADGAMPRHECRIDSPMGTTTLNLETQIDEISNGLFDMIQSGDRVTIKPSVQ
jgi:flagellar assembly protein FliH